jgi:hypothetical protein
MIFVHGRVFLPVTPLEMQMGGHNRGLSRSGTNELKTEIVFRLFLHSGADIRFSEEFVNPACKADNVMSLCEAIHRPDLKNILKKNGLFLPHARHAELIWGAM